jgi:hypothetical protein
MRTVGRIALLVTAGLTASPATARVLKIIDWQAAVVRVTHTDKRGNFDQDSNYAYLLYDYEAVSNAMAVGYDRALRSNALAISAGKAPLFCPPEKRPELRSDEISSYFSTLPADYRKKTPVVDGLLGFAVHKFPCAGAHQH